MRYLAWFTLSLVFSWETSAAAETATAEEGERAEPAAAETPPTPPATAEPSEEPAPEDDAEAEAAAGPAQAADIAPAAAAAAPRAVLERERPPLVNASAQAPPADAVLSHDRIRAPIVEYRTAWSRGVGFLVGDKRTVVVLGNLRDRYRQISVKMANGEGPEVRVASVELSTREETPFVLLHLESELDGTPLQVSETRPGVGDRVFLILRTGAMVPGRSAPGTMEAAETVVTAASTSTLTVGAARSQLWHGSPVFDTAGRVVAFIGSEAHAMRIDHILGEENLRSGRSVISPVFGLRVGTEFGGFMSDPFVLDIEVGLALWDQLGIVFRLGIGLGEEVLVSIPATATREQGIAEGDQRTVGLGLELKYRLLLTRAAMPLYVDIVAGVQYTNWSLETRGMAIYATEPGCDPYGADFHGPDCAVTVGEPPGRDSTHGVGPVFGFDIRVGLFTMGYRFLAERISHRLPDTHRLTFGITYR